MRYLSHAYYDHCPVFLELGGVRRRRLRTRPFRFQAAWMLHPKFKEWMEKEWINEGDLMSSLNKFAEKLKAWNRDTFGCIFERKRRLRGRQEGVLWAMDLSPSLRLFKLEKKLKREWQRSCSKKRSCGCRSQG